MMRSTPCRRHRSTVRLAVLALVMLAVGACATDSADESTDTRSADTASSASARAAGDASPASPAPVPSDGATSVATGSGTTVTTGTAEPYGSVLTDGTGMTLYVFFEDSGGRSMCYDACADNWPPLLTNGDPVAEGEVAAQLLGTLERDDGALQVTYDGQPLYRHAGDSAPGHARGLGNGNTWYPVTPDGAPIDVARGGDRDAAGE